MKEKTLTLSIVLVVLALVFSSFAVRGQQSGIVDVQILAVNDFHGNLQPPSGSSVQNSLESPGLVYIIGHTATMPPLFEFPTFKSALSTRNETDGRLRLRPLSRDDSRTHKANNHTSQFSFLP